MEKHLTSPTWRRWYPVSDWQRSAQRSWCCWWCTCHAGAPTGSCWWWHSSLFLWAQRTAVACPGSGTAPGRSAGEPSQRCWWSGHWSVGGRDWPGRKARPTEKEEIKVFANVVAASVYIMKIVFPLVSVSILQLKLEVGPVFGEKHVQLFPKTCAGYQLWHLVTHKCRAPLPSPTPTPRVITTLWVQNKFWCLLWSVDYSRLFLTRRLFASLARDTDQKFH